MIGGEGLAWLVLLGGALALDRGPFFQSLVSRPLPAAYLAGLAVGDVEAGVWCGLLLEPLWMMRLPVGGVVPPNETVAALVGTAAASAAHGYGYLGVSGAAMGIVWGLPFGWLAMLFDTRVRRMNGRLLKTARAEAKAGHPPKLGRAVALGAFHFMLSAALAVALGAVMAFEGAELLCGLLGPRGAGAFEIVGWTVPAIGAGAVLAGLPGWQSVALFGLGAAGGWAAGGRPWRA